LLYKFLVFPYHLSVENDDVMVGTVLFVIYGYIALTIIAYFVRLCNHKRDA
jgi:hypothetical protein